MTAAWARNRSAPLIIGHRGASAHAVENTMAAFARAAADGADGVELDVRATADGGLVVFHDEDLRRLAGRSERVDRLGAAELAAVRLTGDERIPRLDDVLGELPGLLVNVEIKAHGPRAAIAAVRAVARALGRTAAAERVVISSFDPSTVVLARALCPRVRLGLLFQREQARGLRGAGLKSLTSLVRPFALHPERGMIDRDHMARWRNAGVAVHTWTVDGAAEARRVASFGVDAIITNDPAATRGFLS